MKENMHPCYRFFVNIDKPIPAIGTSYKGVLTVDTQLLVVTKDGEKSTKTVAELLPTINKHNLCITTQVFENCENVDTPIFNNEFSDSTTENELCESNTFEPIDGFAWGFEDSQIAWYKSGDGKMTALVLVPGYRLFAVKEDNSGILVEDTNRDRVFIEWGTFNPALCFATKREFLDYNRHKKIFENYEFFDNDYMLVATKEHNFRTEGQLVKVMWQDFKQLLERFEQNGLDDETCINEGNVKFATPWVAYFKKPLGHGMTVVKAFLGAPGYSIESITQKTDETRPGLNIIDSQGNKLWVSWSGWHDCFNYSTYEAFKAAKERGEIKYSKKRSYANVGKSKKYKTPEISVEQREHHATAIWDVKRAGNLPDEEVMSSLEGITPLR